MGRFYGLLIFISFITFNITQAQTHTWTGNGDGIYWSDPLNWDLGTVPLQNGIGNVVIPIGSEVRNGNVIYFKAGEISGGGTFLNEGHFHMVNDSETSVTKIISNINFNNQGNIYIYRGTGIANSEPIILNNGTELFSCFNCQFTINNIGITTTTPTNPPYIDLNGPFVKSGEDITIIDVKLRICCYDFEVTEGTLILESKYNNQIQSPNIFISENAGLIFSGNNIFSSGAALEGVNQGYLEIKNNAFGNPIVPSTYFFEVEGLLTINEATFTGGGTFRIQKADAIFTGLGDITFDNVNFWVQILTGTLTMGNGIPFNVNLLNGSRISNGGDIFLNGANIIGTGSGLESVSIGGELNVINNIIHHQFNGINFQIIETINLNDGTILLDDSSLFENYFYQNPKFPEYIEYGEVLGSGLFKFPAYNSSTIYNNGVFNPSPQISILNTINYSQTNTAKVFIDIHNLTEYDVISNSGTTHFEGGFEVNLEFEPSIGDEFEVFISDSAINNCQPVTSTSAYFNGLTYVFDVICNTSSIVLRLGEILITKDLSTETQFFTSPNPTNKEISFQLDASTLQEYSKLKIEVYSVYGQKVAEVSVNEIETKHDISSFSSGMYVAKLISEKGVLATTKFVVE